MDIALINKIIVISIDAIGLCLAFWVFFSDRKSKTNLMFFAMTIFILLWVTFAFLASLSSQISNAVLWRRLAFGSSSLFSIPAYYLFVAYFPRERRSLILDKVVISIGLLFYCISIFTDLIIKDIRMAEWGTDMVFGSGIIYLYFMWIPLTFIVVGHLVKKYFEVSRPERLKLRYFLIGVLIFAVFNFIFNVIFPFITKSIRYYQFGDYSTIFLLGFTAIAIVKRELFGIKAILTELLVIIMALVLFIVPFLIDIFWIKILLFFIFFFFCVIGYLLIRYTRREARQKEMLEGKVRERTKELDIKIKELDRWYHLTVGRELRMAEIKKEIVGLKEKLKNK